MMSTVHSPTHLSSTFPKDGLQPYIKMLTKPDRASRSKSCGEGAVCMSTIAQKTEVVRNLTKALTALIRHASTPKGTAQHYRSTSHYSLASKITHHNRSHSSSMVATLTTRSVSRGGEKGRDFYLETETATVCSSWEDRMPSSESSLQLPPTSKALNPTHVTGLEYPDFKGAKILTTTPEFGNPSAAHIQFSSATQVEAFRKQANRQNLNLKVEELSADLISITSRHYQRTKELLEQIDQIIHNVRIDGMKTTPNFSGAKVTFSEAQNEGRGFGSVARIELPEGQISQLKACLQTQGDYLKVEKISQQTVWVLPRGYMKIEDLKARISQIIG